MSPAKVKSREWNSTQKLMRRRRQKDCDHYYENGYCSKSDICVYRHEPRAFGSTCVCPEWKKGFCNLERCPYRHASVALDHLDPDREPLGCKLSLGEERQECSSIFSKRRTIEDKPTKNNSSKIRIVKLLKSGGDHTKCDLEVTVNVDTVIPISGEDVEMDFPKERF